MGDETIIGRTCGRLALASLAFPLLLSGCFVISTHRKLPVPKAPAVVQTATPDELVAQLNKRWDALESLTATVEIQAQRVLKTKEGEAKDYTTIRGDILMRKPEMLRVLGTSSGARHARFRHGQRRQEFHPLDSLQEQGL